MRLRSQRIITPAGTIAGEVQISGGQITSVGPGAGGGGSLGGAGGEEVVELGGRWVIPGFIDVHVHGGGGAQCNTGELDELETMARFHAAHGTTALLATTVAAPPVELAVALQTTALATALRGGAAVLGAHLEGPFLSRRRPGAMDPALFLEPTEGVVGRLLDAGAGCVRLMTLAPELPGALELIGALAGAGVVASVGHSDATYEQTRAAVQAGARAATHLFNAMRPFHHREPGVLGAVLDLPEVSCELICDGLHVQPAALRLAYRAKGRAGIRLVTDAMQAAGMPDGEYHLGTATVTVAGGRATIPGLGSIAGSTLTMDAAVRNAVSLLGVSLEEAVTLASANPARLLGLEARKGAIAPGMDADLTVLDDRLMVCGTIVDGAWVHRPPPIVDMR